jgi:curved DNA-binding protein CbpA
VGDKVKDYYKILNISTNADSNEIKKAFRSLAKKYHPDRNPDDKDALRKFQEVNEAYEVLSKEDSREKYDNERAKFKGNNNRDTDRKNSKANNDNKKYQEKDKGENIENLNKYFESFFGFNANSSNVDKDKLKKEKNPIDTSGMFDSFFNIKKK